MYGSLQKQVGVLIDKEYMQRQEGKEAIINITGGKLLHSGFKTCFAPSTHFRHHFEKKKRGGGGSYNQPSQSACPCAVRFPSHSSRFYNSLI